MAYNRNVRPSVYHLGCTQFRNLQYLYIIQLGDDYNPVPFRLTRNINQLESPEIMRHCIRYQCNVSIQPFQQYRNYLCHLFSVPDALFELP